MARRSVVAAILVLGGSGIALSLAPAASGAAQAVPMCDGLEATYVGPPGGTTYLGTGRDDVIVMGDGDDIVNAGAGDDHICGGTGNDQLQGSLDDDRIFGGTGSDAIAGSSGYDALVGGPGAGVDMIDFRAANSWVKVDFETGISIGPVEDTDIFSGMEGAYGSEFDDKILGTAGPQMIMANRGDDQLRGRGGNDTLNGELGNDSGNGNAGTDTCVSVEQEISCER